MNNISEITGSDNIVLQNITANDITIYSGQETKPEIKDAKSRIAKKIANLIQIVGLRSDEPEDETPHTITDDKFEDIDGLLVNMETLVR